ncbi:MAG: reverse transcriptase family protein [Candidatus Thiodiazotropha sp.]
MLFAVLVSWTSFLILLSGDIELNPGPDSVGGSTDSDTSSSISSLHMLSNHLSIMHLNIQSIVPKLDLIKCETDAYDVLIFSESWLNPQVKNDKIILENFWPPFRTDRCDRPGGGVAIYVRETFSCKRRPDLEMRGLEAVWVEIQIKSRKILVGGFYRPPNSNIAYFDRIKESIDRAYNTGLIDIYILGDFNSNMYIANNNKMRDLIQEFNLKQLINEPTHFTEHSSSLIDLILVRNENNVLMSEVADTFIPNQIRYHCPTILLLKFLRPIYKTFKRRIWNYKLANFDQYREILSDLNLDEKLHTNTDINVNVQQITDALTVAAEQSIPNKIVTIRPAQHPWITCHIKKLIRKRKRNFRKFKRTSNIRFWENYKTLRNQTVSEIRKSKQDYFNKLDTLLSTDTLNTKLFWKTSKQVLNLGKSSSNIPTLILNNEYAESSLQKANMLNSYFISQAVVNDDNKALPQLTRTVQYSLQFIEIPRQDILDVLQNLNISKASGPDLISPILLKEGAEILANPLKTVFNRSLENCYFPIAWKHANVSPIFKKDDRTQPSNYRPISLLSQIGKTMERCVHKQLYNYAIVNHILTPFQSGFIRGDSTTYQLIHTYHTFCEAVDSGKEVRVVFCDISKAFDRVWHRGLIHKLSNIGFSDRIIQWFSSYLSDRKQRVVIEGQASEWAFVQAGVPQGSILGPLLFLLYINDIVSDIGCSIRLFADDTSLYIVVDSPQTAANTLNNDLCTISNWANNWLVDFNASKTISMIISRKLHQRPHPPLFMNNTQLNESENHKHLGVTLSNSCRWSSHIDNITEKAWIRLNLMRGLKFKISRKSLEQIYISFIRPLLEYCDSVWDNASSESKKQLDAIHIEAARTITGATKLCAIDKLFADLGWESLQSRRNKHKLVIFYKIMNGLTPDYLSDLVPPLIQDTTHYNLRNSNDTQTLHANTNLYFNSFFPSTIRAWNDLPEQTKQATSVASFKYLLNKDLKRPPAYFNAGTRAGQVLQARLRTECSSLNSHLYRKNVVSSPSCSCGGFESVHHFFFACPKYSIQRNRYLPDDLHNFTTHDLLFGKENVPFRENESLFLKVQDFVIKSGRFIS